MAEYWVAAGNDLSEGTVVGARQWAVGNNGGYFAVTRRCRAPAPQTSPIRGRASDPRRGHRSVTRHPRRTGARARRAATPPDDQ
jgi:hypothetical protein